jgi:ATP-binding cassette subfamily C (CFTR/MRP) protein 1
MKDVPARVSHEEFCTICRDEQHPSLGLGSSGSESPSLLHELLSPTVSSVSPDRSKVLYYSASTLCFLPILRTTWLLENNAVCSLTWTFVSLLTLLALVLESSTQRSSTAQIDRDVTKEQLASFWGRNFFIYLLPFLRFGYSNTIGISNVPAVDKPLRSKEAYEQLLPVLRRYEGRFRLLRSILSAPKWNMPRRSYHV